MLLHYDFIAEFKRQFYKDALDKEHIATGLIEIPKLTYETGYEYGAFWGWSLEKDGTRYLLSFRDSSEQKRDIQKLMPIIATDMIEVSYRGNVYKMITQFKSLRIRPEQTKSFKEYVDSLASIEHSNKDHYTLMWMLALTCMYTRVNFRIATPAGFGKDSTVDILGNLIGNAATLENPTLAKLEYMTYYSWLAINEVVGIQSAEWKTIQQFLLASGAFKNEITKHSRAGIKTKEILDLTSFSPSLMYNDIDHYVDDEKYFDFVTINAVKDRFVPIRLHGTFKANFNHDKHINPEAFVREQREQYIDILRNYEYYRLNQFKHLHGYKYELPKGLKAGNTYFKIPERWGTNLGRLLHIVDMYSESQQEFDYWYKVIMDAIVDYKTMLLYPTVYEQVSKKIQPKEVGNLNMSLAKLKTFTDKVQLCNNYAQGKKTVATTDSNFWEKFQT